MNITLASQITLLRFLLTPFIVYNIVLQYWGYVLILFFAAMVTDLFDGFIARRYNQVSTFGMLLDPIADKFLIVASLYALLFSICDTFIQFGIWFLILKEFILIVGGALLHFKYDIFIKPSFLSRLASVAEMVLVILFVVVRYLQIDMPLVVQYGIIGSFCLLSLLLLKRYGIYIARLLKS